MSQLHTINNRNDWQLCYPLLNDGDSVVFLENGVYCCSEPDFTWPDAELKIFAIHDDVAARGLLASLPKDVHTIYYKDFVEICCQHDKVVNWF